MTHLVVLAKEVDEDKVTPGVLGFIVFAAMALAVWALMKSMTRHMGKVDFADPADGGDTGAGAERAGARGASREAGTSGPARSGEA